MRLRKRGRKFPVLGRAEFSIAGRSGGESVRGALGIGEDASLDSGRHGARRRLPKVRYDRMLRTGRQACQLSEVSHCHLTTSGAPMSICGVHNTGENSISIKDQNMAGRMPH